MESNADLDKSSGQETASPAGTGSEAVKHLNELQDLLSELSFVNPQPRDASGFEVLRNKVLHQISDYLIPRISNLGAPLLVVVGGSTGSGKSTLVNSLLGEQVSVSGTVRPTTRTPVLAFNPVDQHFFESDRILPELKRVAGGGFNAQGGASSNQALLMTPRQQVPQGLAILDAPDIDSVSDENRELAGQLLNAADLWIFVTTANRYADALPWDLLTEAGARKITVCVVLNRVPPGAENDIVPDLKRLLSDKDLDPTLLHVLNETQLGEEKLIPSEHVEPLLAWLNSLAADSAQRQRIAAQTLDGALRRTAADVSELIAELQEQENQLGELCTLTGERFAQALARINDSLNDGSLLRGEILARWQDFVGAGELLRGIEGAIGRVRDRVGAFLTGKPPATHRVEQAIESGLHTVFIAEITKACHDIDRSWQNTPFGQALRANLPTPRPPKDLPEQASESIRLWQKDVLDMIRQEGAGKRKTARMAAFGVNGVAVILMVVVFASTAGLTGLEIGIAGGSALVGQKLLEAIFGEDAVRRMATKARKMLDSRARDLLAKSSSIYLDELSATSQPELADRLGKITAGLNGKGAH
ncbi:dynamin family protein [Glutamicibacter nicotianae]|uniref:ABC transporter n=1 Tax=Glutamicibacter nicotianae TaxID=37929 RepID=A0ABQ0RHD3_GLUNI|nr:dynamin family protein [Glutamicibacter nicotianae]GEC11238.1 ABC transporter [Glutamicibacter nicotianae]